MFRLAVLILLTICLTACVVTPPAGVSFTRYIDSITLEEDTYRIVCGGRIFKSEDGSWGLVRSGDLVTFCWEHRSKLDQHAWAVKEVR